MSVIKQSKGHSDIQKELKKRSISGTLLYLASNRQNFGQFNFFAFGSTGFLI